MADSELIERNIRVSGPAGGLSRELVAVIDTGASHCQIPEDVAGEIGAPFDYQERILLATGRDLLRDVVGIVVEMDGYVVHTTATLAPPGSPALLGKIALHQMGLGVDPVENRLIKQVVYLLSESGWPTF